MKLYGPKMKYSTPTITRETRIFYWSRWKYMHGKGSRVFRRVCRSRSILSTDVWTACHYLFVTFRIINNHQIIVSAVYLFKQLACNTVNMLLQIQTPDLQLIRKKRHIRKGSNYERMHIVLQIELSTFSTSVDIVSSDEVIQ